MGIGKNRRAEGEKSEQMALLRQPKCHEVTRHVARGVLEGGTGPEKKPVNHIVPTLGEFLRYGWMRLLGSKQLERKNVRIMVTQE